MKTKVLAIVAHPDDEVLGCGATLARHVAEGAEVAILILADGVTSRSTASAKLQTIVDERYAAARRACAHLGVSDVTLLAHADNRMDGVALLDIVQEIEGVQRRCEPSIVYTHHAGDVNIDHRQVHDAVVAACRPLPGTPMRELLFFETPSSSEWRPPASMAPFAPNWFVDVSDYLPKKLAALSEYADELRPFPHPRSLAAVEHLARWRGATIGCAAAEAFELGWKVKESLIK